MNRRTMIRLGAAAVAGVLTATSCSSGTAMRRDPSLLTRDEIETVAVSNLYEAVERLRPRWLEVRGVRSVNAGTTIAVFLNRSYLGGIDVLKTYDVRAFPRLRYLDGATASATLAGYDTSQHLEGAIVLETNAGGI